MAPSPQSLRSPTAVTGGIGVLGALRIAAVALPHLAALGLMWTTEADAVSRAGFLLTWAVLNFFWLAWLRRPALSGALTLALVVLLVLLSRLKHDIVQMTANFVDLMVIDQDTVAFLFTIFPGLKGVALAVVLAGVPLAMLLWRIDPFRFRRAVAAGFGAASFAALIGYAVVWPNEPWQGFYRDGFVSKFARSGVNAVSDYMHYGFMESDAVVSSQLKTPLEDSCQVAGRRPHIILVHDESSYDIRSAPGIKVPPGYGSHFLSFDGKARTFIVEGNGGPSWLTEYNVLAGLSSRSFGRFAYFVTRIAAGRVERGLPHALRRCGYHTLSLYPAYGAFMSARSFQHSTGIEKFFDARALGAKVLEPDRFYYDAALRLFDQERGQATAAGQPMFVFVYLAANHFPWNTRLRPDLTPGWRDPGNLPKIDEYLRRQAMSARDYRDFLGRLKKQYPGEPFLIVRFGDHQPEFSPTIIEPGLSEEGVSQRLMAFDPRYYSTYYAIDAVNYKPAATPTAMATIEAAYLPLIVQELAGLPLDPSFAEQKNIMLRCNGLFYACNGGAEARRFNRLLIDAGLIKGL
ncbi:MAG: LTA synthase family protein [Xanthobacteraceae bacterium]|nr:MAG: LTA synthase family protein [Xanthobacteraceae bacterium]